MTRSRVRLFLPCILLAIGAVVAAQGGGGADVTGAPVAYRLSFPAPQQRWLQVEVTFSGVIGPLEVRMSRSSPGRYALHEFAKNAYDIEAADGGGRRLEALQTDPHQWNVDGHDGTVRFHYKLFGDRVDGTYAAVDATHAHLNTPAVLAWATGLEDRPAVVAIAPPAGGGWRPATQLFATDDPWVFTAPNLQYLMDSPLKISPLAWRRFEPRRPSGVGGPLPTIAFAVHHEGSDADVDRYVRDLEALVPETAAVFGEYPPFEGGRFLFIACYVPWAVGDGMEHRNSTVLTSSASIGGSRLHLVETAVHEFFHAWNAERIRPRSLEPFDFTRANTSRELWLVEGFTSYYQALLMHRAGLATFEQLLSDLGGWVSEVVTSPAHAFRSAEEMSVLAPLVDGAVHRDPTFLENTYISHYTFGAALALGFDLAIRERTKGSRSLDDVMRLMWERHGRPGGTRAGYVDAPYTTADVVQALADVTGDQALAAALIDRHVRGRVVMEYARLLALAGLGLEPAAPGARTVGPVALSYAGGRLRISAAPPLGSPADAAGLASGDEIVAIGGRPVRTVADYEDALRVAPVGARITFRIHRRGMRDAAEVAVRVVADPAVAIVAVERGSRAPTPGQRAFRAAWLSSRAR
jgi:predicted metalloprotease with PDZ domain